MTGGQNVHTFTVKSGSRPTQFTPKLYKLKKPNPVSWYRLRNEVHGYFDLCPKDRKINVL